ncbi:omptin family outer membrane protease [Acinetobacter rathckeae]|uniref:omptin family outer membrane protease n=1 Tax=Acinetobacter rathckeae TaxID=2605272 RepID=UPI0018A266D2|nr:omptin family outer membrane protease [Acinetobacter rathckeae]MBF7688208.1 omptin family outer membrane protease [Acinetobacter rathckeae]MBF7695273.1 omptin family outer membrane protease [Acinetobacter rathckeae]
MYFKIKALNYFMILGLCNISSAVAEQITPSMSAEQNEDLQEIEIAKEAEVTIERQPKTASYEEIEIITQKPTVTLSITPSMLTGGQGKEYLFTNSYSDQISLLTWEIKNVPIIKTDFTWNISPNLSFNMNGWTTVGKKTLTMNDYDWRDMNNRSLLTDWSNHPDTSLNSANKIDLNFTYWLLQKPSYNVGLLFGYEHSQFSWTARGGSYQYGLSDQYGNYMQDTALMYQGHFPDKAMGVGYKQKFSLYYLGLTANYRYNNYEINATAKMSPWVKSKSQDEHYMRDLTIYEKAEDSEFYAVTLNAGYYISPRIKLFTEITWSDYKLAGGTVTIKHSDYEGKGGISSRYYNLGLGAQYIF